MQYKENGIGKNCLQRDAKKYAGSPGLFTASDFDFEVIAEKNS